VVSPTLNASLIRPVFFALVASDFVVSSELCLDLNHVSFCMHDDDQLVEGQVVLMV